MFKNLRLFLPFLKGHYNKYIIAGIELFIVDAIDVSLPLLTGWATDRIINATKGSITVIDATKYLIFVISLYIIGIIAQGLLRYWWRYLFNSASLSIAYNIRNKLFAHLQKLSLNFFHNARTGDIMSRATNDIEWMRMLFGEGIMVILDVSFYLLMVPFIMFKLNPTLLLYAIGCSIFMPFFVRSMGERLHKKSTEVQESLSAISQSAEENFSGIRVVKSFAQEENQLKRFEQTNELYLKKNLSLAKLSSFFHPFFGLNVSICVFVVILVGGLQAIKGTMSPGDIVAFLLLLGRIIWPMAGVGVAIMIYQRASASMERLQQIFNIQPEVSDKGTKPAPQTSNLEVEFKNVDFSHKIPDLTDDGIPKQDSFKQVQVLKNINLKIPPNSTVAITGPIGSGKTILLNLLCRFYDCDRGGILINGVNIKEYPLKDLRSMMGIVPQDIFLFSDTIKDNITFGLDTAAADEQIVKATESVAMHETIDSLPEKYDAYLGERGINMSGGQRQRVTLARALIKNPPLLILDDCFSSVDYETEQKILKNIIENKSKSQTVIVVSHRLAVMGIADFIVFMYKGEIVEQGTHQELIAKNNVYARFCEYQSIKEKLDEIN
ncbi:MAG: ABC transporter ATP-binding protein [Planctomycetota bacterium]